MKCLLGSNVSHKFFALNWYIENELEIKGSDYFGVQLVDKQEGPCS